MTTELSADEHNELVARLTSLLALAEGLAEAYDDPAAAAGAREMLASIERMLELVGAPRPPE
jgi:hypothetical protein